MAEIEGPGFECTGTKEIGNVECNIYEGDHGRVYVFQEIEYYKTFMMIRLLQGLNHSPGHTPKEGGF